MRRSEKQRAEDFVKVLEEAHGEIGKYIDKAQLDTAMDLLGQCQEGAIKLGELIERTEGEGFVTIGGLEAYCELVYRIYEAIRQGNQEQYGSGSRVCKTLNKKLVSIGNSIRNDIPIRREAVFLPYKASMWDSLESVWRAADADEQCDAYVIPIPYYDRKPDGSFGQLHYEGANFPEDVPVTHYDDYDFSRRRPDMIFIHNPYDDCNRVTSVAPFFYSKNLKQFTEKLIYIPYFLLGEIDPADQPSIENMKHFCLVPGVINADKVIVQSEDMRRIYVDVLTEAAGEENRVRWEEKILGLGSPKVDKALETCKRMEKLPETWRDVIEKADGSRKKVIFYNTSVGSLLQHGEKELQKMQSVFSFFQKHQEDVVLLWRPHPLMDSTIRSMRPEMWAMWEAAVERFKKEDIGIYDDTADLNRALSVSDAYYGDHSSVVQLCREAGIPVMIQNVEILEK